MPYLELDKVSQSYPRPDGKGAEEVLRELSFSAEKNEVICVLGPSGCGKSTVLRLVSGMHDRYTAMPSSGQVTIAGKAVAGPHPSVLTVFQKPVLKAWLDVRGNVALPFKSRLWGRSVEPAERKQRIDKALQSVGLSQAAALKPRQLSGGMKQRVSLAARLVLRPSILCLDEPFSALDPQTRGEMQELVLELWKEFPCLALFVTHDVDEALRIADRVIVLSTRPATIVADLSISERKPRSEAWMASAEATELSRQIVGRIRDAATAERAEAPP